MGNSGNASWRDPISASGSPCPQDQPLAAAGAMWIGQWNRQLPRPAHVFESIFQRLIVELELGDFVVIIDREVEASGRPSHTANRPGRAGPHLLGVQIDGDFALSRQQRWGLLAGIGVVAPAHLQLRSCGERCAVKRLCTFAVAQVRALAEIFVGPDDDVRLAA